MNKDLDELKKIELDILKQFIKVCDMLNINYYLIGGTLIGAIRHNGFIPWDDDIDVCLFREDYNKFIHEGQKYLPKKYFIQTYETDKNYLNCFAKIRNSETTYIESSVKNLDINHGIYIDIFPLDNFYNHNFLKEKLIQMQIYNEYNKTIIKKIAFIFSKILYGKKSKLELCKMKDMIYTKYNDKNTLKIVNYCGAWGAKKESHFKADYNDFIVVDFENIKVKIPKGYDRVLKDTYGDYMKLPPVEKRVGHHYYEVLDTNKSYKNYIK